ncbi:uncharacterized protein LOC126652254 [Myiozetetes cayanensis]|uniref:uncharacterized protein LOC126652254 n=1 Tax=Myiozetetes cayanensis TaxID=478635 RepID=UPI00215F549B|nr:uncharacterized protein LOC126652254 [Myiozetetes cayanensis]
MPRGRGPPRGGANGYGDSGLRRARNASEYPQKPLWTPTTPCRGRGPSGSPRAGGPPEKKPPREEQPPTTLIEPLRLGGISSTEEMDVKVLQFRNKKLLERLEQRQVCEDELRERIEKLEKRQATDDATLHLVNRYWAQVRHLRNTPGGIKHTPGHGRCHPAPGQQVLGTGERHQTHTWGHQTHTWGHQTHTWGITHTPGGT